jgi:hypothetical protein
MSMLIRAAEAIAESDSVRDVRAAGNDPRLWPAATTYLERRHPEKWVRRTENDNGPKIIVQIGARDSDVQVQLVTVSAAPASLDIGAIADSTEDA